MANKLHFEATMDGTGFQRGINTMTHSLAHGLKGLVAAGFGVYSIHQALSKTVESADELINTSQRLGVTVEQLQVLRQAAKNSGVEFGKLASAFDRLDAAREKALGGDTKSMEAFARMGVSEADLRSKGAAEIFSGPMAGAARGQSAQDLAGPMRDIFGKGARQLIATLQTDFDGLRDKMESLGSIMSTEAAVAVDVLADEFGLLSNIIVAQLAPALAMLGPALLKFWGFLQSSGSYLVTQFGNQGNENDMSFNEWLLAIGAGLRQTMGYGDTVNDKALAAQEKLGNKTIDAETAKAETTSEQEKLQKTFADEIAKMTERLKNPPKPEIAEGLAAKAKAKPTGRADFASDSLLAVGNFLGGGSGMVNSIAEKHLAEAQTQTALLTEQGVILREIADKDIDSGMDF